MKKVWTGVLMLLLFLNLNAQDAPTFEFSLEEAIDYAYKNHPSIRNAQLDERIAQAQRNEVRGIGLPQVNASIGFQDFFQLPTSLIPSEFLGGDPGEFAAVQFGTQYNASAGVEMTQLIFSGDYIVALQSSKTYFELSQKATQMTRIDIAEAVSKAYYSVLGSREMLELLDANIEQLDKILKDTRAMYDAGFVEEIDVKRLQVSLNNLHVEKKNLQKLNGLGLTLLKFQMSMDLSADLSLTDNLEEADLSPPKDFVTPFNYGQRMEYSLLQTQKKLAEQELKLNQYAYYPTVAGFLSMSTQAQRNEFNFFDTKEKWYGTGLIGFNISIPIFNGLQRKFKVDRTQLNLIKMDNNFDLMEQGIDLELATTRTMLENSLQSVEVQLENMSLAQSIYDTVVKKYNEGVGSNLEIVEAETSLKTAQTNYFSALYDAIVAKIDFQKANGSLGY